MNHRIEISPKNANAYFYFQSFTSLTACSNFDCGIPEYNDYLFRTIPAMKIAKLAVDGSFSKKYKGIGTFMITGAERLAWACNATYCAARFLTVDADIEHDEGVFAFYEKNGFIPNAELYNKNRKTISMRKDLYK